MANSNDEMQVNANKPNAGGALLFALVGSVIVFAAVPDWSEPVLQLLLALLGGALGVLLGRTIRNGLAAARRPLVVIPSILIAMPTAAGRFGPLRPWTSAGVAYATFFVATLFYYFPNWKSDWEANR